MNFYKITSIGKYLGIIIPIIAILGLVKIYKLKEEDEKYLILKMIVFYFLGVLSFNINITDDYVYIALPIGFLLYCLFMKDKKRKNKALKDRCAVLGVIILTTSCVINGIHNYIQYKDVSVNSKGNVEDLSSEWQVIKSKSKIGDEAVLCGAIIDYNKNKEIEDLTYYIIDYNKNKTYTVNLENEQYIVRVDKYDENTKTYSKGLYDNKTEDFLKVVNHITTSRKNLVDSNEIIYEKNLDDSSYGYDLYSVNIKKNQYKKIKQTHSNRSAVNYYEGENSHSSIKHIYRARYILD